MIFGSAGNFLLFFLNFIKYFLNKLTPYTQENELQLFSTVNLSVHGFSGMRGIFYFFLNFIKYFLNKLTPYTQENELQLFSIVNLSIHGYAFRGCGGFFTFFYFVACIRENGYCDFLCLQYTRNNCWKRCGYDDIRKQSLFVL
jgi:hypothetical protein